MFIRLPKGDPEIAFSNWIENIYLFTNCARVAEINERKVRKIILDRHVID